MAGSLMCRRLLTGTEALIIYAFYTLNNIVLINATSLTSLKSPMSACATADFKVRESLQSFVRSFPAFLPLCTLEEHRGLWGMVTVIALCGLIRAYRLQTRRPLEGPKSSEKGLHAPASHDDPSSDTLSLDPGLLRKHSTYKSYVTTTATYPSIRTFYRPHTQADKLPYKPTPLPLLVFIHGLGGSLAQFSLLLTSLVNVAPCFGIDLPGCGLSRFSPRSWQAYSHTSLVQLLEEAITQHCDLENGQEVILVGHSMGCSLAVSLASSLSKLNQGVRFRTVGLISICPKASNITDKQLATYRKLLSIPTAVFDLWRRWDRRGGVDSVSVTRFVGKDADIETKKLQLRYNEQSRSAVWRRMAWGALPTSSKQGSLGGLPGPEIWAGLAIPVFLVAGELDDITKPEEIEIISKAIRGASTSNTPLEASEHTVLELATSHVRDAYEADSESRSRNEIDEFGTSSTGTTFIEHQTSSESNSVDSIVSFSKRKAVLKTSILPSPATHALLYQYESYRTLAGLIQTFLADHIDSRLSLGWQLQHLTTEGKWDVKNLSDETLREIDTLHSPQQFVTRWRDKIKAVIDISHESPVYNPQGLEAGGVEYHKFPTVSKIPPTSEEVKEFIALVDRLRSEGSPNDTRLIGVHCHYGFNRTGFFISSYLIEREGFTVQQAVDEFQAKRPPGIRHEHFLDTLFVRYCMGLKRAPTM